MLFCESVCIGFLSLREQTHCLYLETLQLLPEYRRRGIGTGLMTFVEEVATRRAKDRIQLRVFKGNPVQSLYNRLGLIVIEDQDWCVLMEKVLETV